MAEEIPNIHMIRQDLEDIPQYPLPPGFSARWYRQGYEKHWLDIQSAADRCASITPDCFEWEFGTDHDFLAQRQSYLLDPQGRFIGTASAWFLDKHQQSTGQVHWVAIIPDMQGQGLAKPLLTIVCNRLRELGHERAYLRTAMVRIPAINLYRKFGFVPYIRTTEDLKIWSSLQDKLKRPFEADSLSRGFFNDKEQGWK